MSPQKKQKHCDWKKIEGLTLAYGNGFSLKGLQKSGMFFVNGFQQIDFVDFVEKGLDSFLNTIVLRGHKGMFFFIGENLIVL